MSGRAHNALKVKGIVSVRDLLDLRDPQTHACAFPKKMPETQGMCTAVRPTGPDGEAPALCVPLASSWETRARRVAKGADIVVFYCDLFRGGRLSGRWPPKRTTHKGTRSCLR